MWLSGPRTDWLDVASRSRKWLRIDDMVLEETRWVAQALMLLRDLSQVWRHLSAERHSWGEPCMTCLDRCA